MIARASWAALRLCVIIPSIALAAVADPSQFAQQSTRVSALAVAHGAPQEEMVSQLMVKPRYQLGAQLKTALQAHDARALVNISNVPMSVVRPMSGEAHVIRREHPVTLSEARVIAARLMRDSSVELAEPDRRKRPALTPNDPDYAIYQWNLFAPASQNLGSANLPNAWNITTGSNAVTVAVIDTGYRPHQDFGFTYSSSGNISPVVLSSGYTFITDIPTANNGVGRGSDALDPGDWITGTENTTVGGPFYGCGVLDSAGNPINQLSPSSWHGTHVSGIVAAQMNNGIGIAGVAPNIQILPVRVLGKCGGYDSDIIDGMRWAAGIPVTGVPTNSHPAQVLNMSLGGGRNPDGSPIPCSQSYQSAVNDVISAGKVIVIATGNDGGPPYYSTTLSSPANCTGVISVTANAIDGDNAWYATIGPGTTISAPGGDCGGMNQNCIPANYPGVYSLLNSGTTTPTASPGGDSYVAYSGTSMATPHVAAVAALMFSVNPSLTPTQISSYLQSSARPFPSNTVCTTNGSGLCGTGLLDAYQALTVVKASVPPPVVTLGSIPTTVAPGDVVTLSGSATVGAGWSIASYAWTQLSGPTTVAINNANTAMATFTAPSTGTYSFKLTATDNRTPGQTGTATAVIVVNSPPVLTALPTQMVTAGQTLNFTVTATDPDGDTPIIFNAVSLPAAGATLSATGNFSWPNASPAGNYTLTYYASDPYNANSAQGTVSITVTTASAASSGGSSKGGGSMDTATLAVLALLAAGLRLRRRYTNPRK